MNICLPGSHARGLRPTFMVLGLCGKRNWDCNVGFPGICTRGNKSLTPPSGSLTAATKNNNIYNTHTVALLASVLRCNRCSWCVLGRIPYAPNLDMPEPTTLWLRHCSVTCASPEQTHNVFSRGVRQAYGAILHERNRRMLG